MGIFHLQAFSHIILSRSQLLAFHEVWFQWLTSEDVFEHLLVILHISEFILVQVYPDLAHAGQLEASVASERSHWVLKL